MKKMIAFRNFFLNNTPEKAQLIGDLCMILGFIAGLPAFIEEAAQTQGMHLLVSAFVITASKWASIGLLAIKFITKFFGKSDATNTPNSDPKPSSN